MKNVALVNIKTEQLKKALFPVLKYDNLDVLEISSVKELKMLYAEYKDAIVLYIQEFDSNNRTESFARVNIIDRENTNVILLIEEQDVDIAEQASSLGVKDVVVYPFDFGVLDRRIKSILGSQAVALNKMVEAETKFTKEFNFDILNDEISRSKRGHYPVMIVVVSHSKYINNNNEEFLENLKKYIRTTDTIEIYNSSTIVIYCPFTPKANYEILRGKIRESFINYNSDKRVNANYISALTFPDDFDSDKEVSEVLKEQIEDNSLYFDVDNPNSNIDLQVMRNRIRKNFITYQ